MPSQPADNPTAVQPAHIGTSVRAEQSALPTGDVYFSADVETDGPIPGSFSMLAVAFVKAGTFDGKVFRRADRSSEVFYAELKPISRQIGVSTVAQVSSPASGVSG